MEQKLKIKSRQKFSIFAAVDICKSLDHCFKRTILEQILAI